MLNSIAKMLKKKVKNKKSSRSQYLLSVLAISAIADKAMAEEHALKAEGVIIDVVKLLKDQGVSITLENIDDIVLALANGQEGQLIDLGYGLYQFIPLDSQEEIALQISSVLLDSPISTEISLIDFAPVTDATTIFAEADVESESSGFEFSLPMLGLIAVAAAGGSGSNSLPSASVIGDDAGTSPADQTSNPFEGADAGADLRYVDAYNATSAENTNLVYSEFSLGTFNMSDSSGAPVGGASDVTGSFIIDSTTGLGVGSFSSVTPFFGNLWKAHDVAIQLSDDGTTAELNTLFDWGATSNIFVTLDVAVTVNGGEITSFETLDGAGVDGIMGDPMDNGPFNGFSAAFDMTTEAFSTVDVSNIDDALAILVGNGISYQYTTTTDEATHSTNIDIARLSLGKDDTLDGDTDNYVITNASVVTVGKGSVVINTDGGITYTAADKYENGSVEITYTITDGSGTELVVLDGNNNPTDYGMQITVSSTVPHAIDDDAIVVAMDTTFNNIDVLANDVDPDSGNIVYIVGDDTNNPAFVTDFGFDASLAPSATNGTVTINTDGTLNYSPDNNFIGDDIITYTITDGAGVTDTATVNVSVTLDGIATDGPLDSALVFYDLDNDDILDAGEAFAITANDGSYSLNVDGMDTTGGTLVARSVSSMSEDELVVADMVGTTIQTLDTITLLPVDNIIMRATGDATVISPLTTLIEEGMSNNEVLEAFGLATTYDINNYNPFAEENKNADGTLKAEAAEFEELAVQIYSSINAIAKVIGSVSDKSADDIYKDAYSQLIVTVETHSANTSTDKGVLSFTDDSAEGLLSQVTMATATKVNADLQADGKAQVELLKSTYTLEAITANVISKVNDSAFVNKAKEESVDNGNDTSTDTTIGEWTYDLTGIFQMREPDGADYLDGAGNSTTDETVTGSLTIDHATGNGTITMDSTQNFFGQPWTADDITISKQVDGTYLADMMFHWGANDIHVTLDLDVTFNADGTATLTGIDGPGADGVIGNPMDNGPFNGQNAGFDFTLTNATKAVLLVAGETANELPILISDSQTGAVTEDDASASSASGQVVAIDVEGPLVFTSTGTASYGTFAVEATTGAWTYDIDNAATNSLSAGATQTETFSVIATDLDGASVSQDVTITVTGTNDVPVATANTITAGSTTYTDFTFNGGLFEMRDTTGADVGGATDVVGTMSIDMATGAGTATFSSVTPFFGQLWSAHDITVQMTGTDTMSVNMLFDWGVTTDIAVTVDMGVVFAADGSATFTTLDSDGDGIIGTAMDNGPFLGFTAAFSGTTDVAATRDVEVSAVTEDIAYDNIVILDNDSDVDGDTLTVSAATAANGSVTINADNTLNYLGNQDFNGSETITYTISDNNGGTDSSTVTFDVDAVNDLPVLTPGTQTGAVTEDDASASSASGQVVAIDVEGPLVFTSTGTASYGTFAVEATTGAWTYDIDNAATNSLSAGATQTETFSVIATDLDGASVSQDVTITVTGTNDVPVATANTITAGSTTYTDFTFNGGLFEMRDTTGADVGGATDVVGTMSIDMATGAGTATFSSVTPFFGQLWSAHDITVQMTGTDTMSVNMLFDWGVTTDIAVTVDMGVVFAADGSATFTTLDSDGDGIIGTAMDNGPFLGFTAAFSGTTDVAATRDVEVSAVTEDDTTAYEISLDSTLANITDADADDLSFTSFNAANGTVVNDQTPTTTTLNTAYTFSDATFIMSDTDGANIGGSDAGVEGTLVIDHSNPNTDGTFNVSMTLSSEDAFFGQTWTATVTSAVLDLEANVMSTEVIFEWGTNTIANGTEIYVTMQNEVTFNADGTATFTTLDGDSNDGVLGDPMDNGPFVGFTADFSAANMIATNTPEDVYSYETAPTGNLLYTPDADFNGTEIITYVVDDGNGGTATSTVSFDVAAVNDAPTGAVTIAGTAESGSTLTASDTLADVDGMGAVTYTWTDSQGNVLTDSIDDGDDATLVGLSRDLIDDTVIVTATYTDGDSTAESVASTAVTIADGNTAPVVTGAIGLDFNAINLAEDDGNNSITIDLNLYTDDADADVLTFTTQAASTMGGAIINNGDGTIKFTAPFTTDFGDTIKYTATDPFGTEDSGSVTLVWL